MFDVREYTASDGSTQRYGQFIKPDTEPKTGRALWFVPGLGGSVKGAIPFLEHLLPQFDTIYGADLRGFGLNPIDEPLRETEIIRKDLEAFYQQVIVPAGHSDLVLGGISLGGVLTTLMAVEHPARFSRLLLLAPAYKAHPSSFSLGYIIKNVLGCALKGKGYRTRLPYGQDSVTRNEDILNDPAMKDRKPLDLTAGFLLDVQKLTGQSQKRARELKIPTMMVIPGADVVCCPEAMRKGYTRIPDSTPKFIREYPDFYHDVLYEKDHSHIGEDFIAWMNGQSSAAAADQDRKPASIH